MVFNFVLFTIKIERKHVTEEQRIAENARAHYLETRAEAHALESAQLMARI